MATVGVGLALMLASTSPALAFQDSGQNNAAEHCANGPATGPGAPGKVGGGCVGHFFGHS
jgi:hypothetical protein